MDYKPTVSPSENAYAVFKVTQSVINTLIKWMFCKGVMFNFLIKIL